MARPPIDIMKPKKEVKPRRPVVMRKPPRSPLQDDQLVAVGEEDASKPARPRDTGWTMEAFSKILDAQAERRERDTLVLIYRLRAERKAMALPTSDTKLLDLFVQTKQNSYTSDPRVAREWQLAANHMRREILRRMTR